MKINNVERIEYDLVTLEDETLLRRSVDGQWQQNMWDEDEGWWWMDWSSTDSRTMALEELYQQQKEPPKPGMSQMTEEHIIALARHGLDLGDNEIRKVRTGVGFARLEWGGDHEEGSVLVDDDIVLFSFGGANNIAAGLAVLRLIASWGYDVMKEGCR